MKYIRKIDENGMFIEDGFVEELTPYTIEMPCPAGFYRPKWNGEQWIEGLTEAEILAIRNQPIQPQEPTLEEKVAELQQVIVELTTVLNDKGIVQ